MIVFVFLLCCLCNASPLLHLRDAITSPRTIVTTSPLPPLPPLPPQVPHGCRGDGQMCGGVTVRINQCPQGSRCVDDPNDNCDPASGGAGCIGHCQCNVACPIMDCFRTEFCEWSGDPTWDENGCQLTCGTLICEHSCFENQVWSPCGAHPDCQRRCDSPDVLNCPRICLPGCVCRPGFALLDDGTCLALDQCPGEIPHGCRGDGQACNSRTFAARQCPQGSRCVDDPNDNCGGVDCVGHCQCNVACPIMDCFRTEFCEWTGDPTWDENGCQTSCGILTCEGN